MSGVNKAIIVGNLGNDPEMRQTQSGSAVANFSVATNRKYKGSDGQLVEETEWHRVVAFARLAEICGQYLHKGKQVYIEGRLQTRKWQDKDGQDRWSTEIVAQEMQMLGGRGGDSGGGSPDWGGSQEPVAAKGQAGGNMAAGQEDDDLPF